jgi:hypothetical protein
LGVELCPCRLASLASTLLPKEADALRLERAETAFAGTSAVRRGGVAELAGELPVFLVQVFLHRDGQMSERKRVRELVAEPAELELWHPGPATMVTLDPRVRRLPDERHGGGPKHPGGSVAVTLNEARDLLGVH